MSTETFDQPLPISPCELRADSPVASRDSTSKSAVVSPVPSPTRPSNISMNAEPRSPRIPPGYKLIRRRKEDGTLITILRKMSDDELEAAKQMSPTSETNGSSLMAKEGLTYKVITVRDSDGALIRVKRPIKPEASASACSSPPATQDKADAETDTVLKPKVDGQSKSIKDADVKSSESPNHADEKVPASANTAMIGQVVEQEKSIDLAAALLQQKKAYRQKRLQRLRGSLIRGLGTVLGSSIAHTNFDIEAEFHHRSHEAAGDIEDGDIIDSDQSWSDDNDDGDDIFHGLDDHVESGDGVSTQIHFNAGKAANGVITALAARAASTPVKPAPVLPSEAAEKETPDKDKISYKITAKDLEEMDQKAAEKDLERPLRRHWANATFYLMGSLSIVLPLLFMLLAICVFAMGGKTTKSRWHVMPEVIKVGISAWPIVFAAVVAQVFKAYATWRVERGIKLIQLEQLVGSNSFGSAIKQPMVLRKLDALSVLLLLTWCLSPFGSQALQRSYQTGFADTTDYPEVFYLNQTGFNQVFASDWNRTISPLAHAADNQVTAILFLSTLVPEDQSSTSHTNEGVMDQYNHPILYEPINGTEYPYPVAESGLPIVLPDTKLPQDVFSVADTTSLYESILFNVTSSYFDFTCGDWSVVNYTTIATLNSSQQLAWSSSNTLGIRFTDPKDTSTITHVLFASANLGNDSVEDVFADRTSWTYSLIQCDFEQRFIDTLVYCGRWPASLNEMTSSTQLVCQSGDSNFTSPNIDSDKNMGTPLEDFSDDWTAMSAPRNPDHTGVSNTPTELYVGLGYVNYSSTEPVNLSMVDPAEFAGYFGVLFNTWVGTGYCPQCSAINDPSTLGNSSKEIQQRYVSVSATREYSGEQVYLLSLPWTIAFLVSTVLLLLAGILSVIVESITVAPDTLGYVSTVARNSRYLHVKPTSSAMTGAERARKLANTQVMMQDVKANADVGKIALGLKSEKAVQLQANRLYR